MGPEDRFFGEVSADSRGRRARRREPDNYPENDTLAEEEDVDDETKPREVNAMEVQRQLEEDDPPVLLDVREKPELQRSGWIPQSIHIPMSQIQQRIGELDPSRPTVVYCAIGMRSFDVGIFLLQNGFRNVANLTGGIKDWPGKIERD